MFPAMRRATLHLVLGLAVFQSARLPAQECRPGPVALVLSGGGAKGLAHIGVLRAMDSLGIRPDLIVGTSMGAVVGAMYASGYSGRQIDSLARSLPLTQLFRTYVPRVPSSLGPLQPLVVWERDPGGPPVLQRSAVLEPEVNAMLNAGLLRGNLQARGNFDSLPVPFRAVATDLLTGQPVVLSQGDLARAVRASAAIPVIFSPERVDGRYLGDGGLSANVPIAIARAAGARRLIVSFTTERPPDSLDLESPFAVLDLLVGNLFRQSTDSIGPRDIAIRPDVDGFRSLNFARGAVTRLIQRGLDAGMEALAAASCLPRGTVARGPLPGSVGEVTIEGAARGDSAYVARKLGLVPHAPLNLVEFRNRLRNLGRLGRFEALWLYPRGQGDSVSFRLTPLREPVQVFGAGAMYDNDLGGRVWLGASNRHLLTSALEGTALLRLGELGQSLTLGVRQRAVLGQLVTPFIEVEGSRELVRRFNGDEERARLEVPRATGLVGLEREWRGTWRGRLGVEGAAWGEAHGRGQHAVGVRADLEHVGEGAERLFSISAVANSRYQRLEIQGIATITLGGWKIRPRVHYGIGDSLPPHLQFPLGGEIEGFAGRHIGEGRSQQDVSGGLILLRRLRGPLDLRIEPMAGLTGSGDHFLPEGRALLGLRAGLNLRTSLGPIRAEYGISDGGRDAILVRLGRWF